jgi:hypothetical protein
MLPGGHAARVLRLPRGTQIKGVCSCLEFHLDMGLVDVGREIEASPRAAEDSPASVTPREDPRAPRPAARATRAFGVLPPGAGGAARTAPRAAVDGEPGALNAVGR